MTKILNKPIDNELEKLDILDEIDNYRGKWQNIYLTKKGDVKGSDVHNSEQDAIDAMNESITRFNLECLSSPTDKLNIVDDNNRYLHTYPDDYITTIQMPIKEKE